VTKINKQSSHEDEPIHNRYQLWVLEQGFKIAVYARQSTKEQLIKNLESAEYQTQEMMQLAHALGGDDDSIILYIENKHKDGTIHRASGRLRIDQREGLQSLVERIIADEVKAVVVFMLDRLFRDEEAIQYNTFISICKQHGCVVICPEYGRGFKVYNFNNRDDVSMFRRKMEEAANYLEDVIKGRMLMLRDRKAMRGEYAGHSVPMGYLLDTTSHYTVYEPHAEVIRSIFKRFRELDGQFYELGKELQCTPFVFPDFQEGVAIPHISQGKVDGGYGISRNGLRGLLTNVSYIGWSAWKGTIVSKDNHEAIVNEALFWYAWNRLSPVTVEGEERIKAQVPPTRYTQVGSVRVEALLSQVITSPNNPVYIH